SAPASASRLTFACPTFARPTHALQSPDPGPAERVVVSTTGRGRSGHPVAGESRRLGGAGAAGRANRDSLACRATARGPVARHAPRLVRRRPDRSLGYRPWPHQRVTRDLDWRG